jgi:hypothetical protein
LQRHQFAVNIIQDPIGVLFNREIAVAEIKSKDRKNRKPSEADKLIATYAAMGIGMMLVAIVGVVFVGIVIAMDAPRADRIQNLREATCARYGMTLRDDKYHPAVCAFRVDEEGTRIPD